MRVGPEDGKAFEPVRTKNSEELARVGAWARKRDAEQSKLIGAFVRYKAEDSHVWSAYLELLQNRKRRRSKIGRR